MSAWCLLQNNICNTKLYIVDIFDRIYIVDILNIFVTSCNKYTKLYIVDIIINLFVTSYDKHHVLVILCLSNYFI